MRFTFPENVVEAFTCGDCGDLAYAIHDLSGYPIVTVSGTEDHDWVHAGVLLPDGNVLDIKGVFTPEEWLEGWSEHFDPQDYADTNWDGDTYMAIWEDNSFPRYGVLGYGIDPTDWAGKVLEAAEVTALV